MARFAGLAISTEIMVSPDDADARKELLLLAPSIRVPCLTHDGAKVWNTLAIAQYLNEIKPDAGLMPDDRHRPRALPLGERRNEFRLRQPAGFVADEPEGEVSPATRSGPGRNRTSTASSRSGPIASRPTVARYLFGAQRGMADAMFAPVVTRFLTYDVKLNKSCILYCQTIMAMPEMKEWIAAAKLRAGRYRRVGHGLLKVWLPLGSPALRERRATPQAQGVGEGTSQGASARPPT